MSKTDPVVRSRVIACLIEGMGVRPTSRAVGVAVNTVQGIIRTVGAACVRLHNERVRGLAGTDYQCDEQWAFCYSRDKNVPASLKGVWGYGDVWLWTSLCTKTKIVPAWLLGDRTQSEAVDLMRDLHSRLNGQRFQINTDGFNGYATGVIAVGCDGGQIDWARVIKSYATPSGVWDSRHNRYQQPSVTAIRRERGLGQPDLDRASTSYAERLNLGTRQHCRKMARLTNGHAKAVHMLEHSLAINFTAYNWVKRHESLGGRTPAMANGLTDRRWTASDLEAYAYGQAREACGT